MSKFRCQIWMFATSLLCLFLDLSSKYWAHNHLQSGDRQVIIPGLINLILTSNTGFAFSIGQKHQLMAQVVASTVFLVLLGIYSKRYLLNSCRYPWLEQLGMSIIIGSAAGNLLERWCYGKVTDFFEFAFVSFPVFNLADALIDAGIVLILVSTYCFKPGQHKDSR